MKPMYLFSFLLLLGIGLLTFGTVQFYNSFAEVDLSGTTGNDGLWELLAIFIGVFLIPISFFFLPRSLVESED